VITRGIILVNFCPPATVAASPFHWKMPQCDVPVSNQYVPFSGSDVGAVVVGNNCLVSTSARITQAALLTPRKL
jgi:hypothetical protein